MDRPRIFIGSSVEGIRIVEALATNLDHEFEVVSWTDFFRDGMLETLRQLVERAVEFDGAILVFTQDDPIEYRGTKCNAPRDNVVFELGLFLGLLGPSSTFVVHERSDSLKLPTDMAGVSPITFTRHRDGNLQASVNAACARIKTAIRSQAEVKEEPFDLEVDLEVDPEVDPEVRDRVLSLAKRWRVAMERMATLSTEEGPSQSEAAALSNYALRTAVESLFPNSFAGRSFSICADFDLFAWRKPAGPWMKKQQETRLEKLEQGVAQVETDCRVATSQLEGENPFR